MSRDTFHIHPETPSPEQNNLFRIPDEMKTDYGIPEEMREPLSEAEAAYDRFEQSGSIADYLSYKHQSAYPQGGFPIDYQNQRHRSGKDPAQFPGQHADPAHF